MGYRVNERNTGSYSLEGNRKTRKTAINRKLNEEDKCLIKAILERVYDSLEYDEVVSDVGHLHNDAQFTDGGRFHLSLSRVQLEALSNIIYEKNL